MDDWIIQNEADLRLTMFLGILIAMMLYEVLAPRRRLRLDRGHRWWSNLGLLVIDGMIIRLGFPIVAVGVAQLAGSHGWGLLNTSGLPFVVSFVFAIIILDLIVYAQHVLLHRIPVLWRLHRVHHSDADFDVTTAVRFHPIEIALSMGIKMFAVLALGPPVAAVVVFEILLNGSATFNHSNINIPRWIDRRLRLFIVTPDMHRVHHSVLPKETNSNYGFFLPWWDRLFNTYCDQPRDGHDDMTIGLPQFKDHQVVGLWRLLMQPFVRRYA